MLEDRTRAADAYCDDGTETVAAGGAMQQMPRDLLATELRSARGTFPVHAMTTVTSGERYLHLRELGRGGMGQVDVVFDKLLVRPVARKTALDPLLGPMLAAEARVGAQLEHPAIVPVYDAGTDGQGRPCYVMRVVNGRTLKDVLATEGRLDVEGMGHGKLLGVVRQVCLALDYAHSRGVVHRDLKPANIVVCDFGEVYVIDWGVAFVMESSDVLGAMVADEQPTVAGSPLYMAPEQARGERVDGRTDVYALGLILHELLTGAHPLRAHDGHRLEAPKLDAALQPPFRDLIERCLDEEVTRRPARAREIAEVIDAYLDVARARAESEREAAVQVAEGEREAAAFAELSARAADRRARAERSLVDLPTWELGETKRAAWADEDEALELEEGAARAFARAEVAYRRALGRVTDHREARRGLAALYMREYERAEQVGDHRRRAHYLELARSYDDGTLAPSLSQLGVLHIRVDGAAVLALARYRTRERRLVLGDDRPFAQGAHELEAGSYLLTATCEHGVLRYPLVVRRGMRHRLILRPDNLARVPRGMQLVPGGPFLALRPREEHLVTMSLPDFAIDRFPVTFRQYAKFLDALDATERTRRTPSFLVPHDGGWRLSDSAVEGEGRKRVPPERELDLPVHDVNFYDALAYAAWRSLDLGAPLRLPTAEQWQKAARGADGRVFPMGEHLDPAFAKIRHSRPESPQLEPVGAFALDESPYAVRDLAGSVCDWSATMADGAPAPPPQSEADPRAAERQAYYLGGHWGSNSATRGINFSLPVAQRHTAVSIRLVLTLPPGSGSELHVEPL